MTANTFGTLNILMKYSSADGLASFLPEELHIPPVHREHIPPAALSFTMSWLAAIHPSWIGAALKECPPVIQSQLLAWLPPSLVKELQPFLAGVPIANRRCSSFGAFYLLDMLSKKIRPPGITNEIFLPPSPFNAILYYSGHTKMTLIDCLGLFVVAKELKNVVDRRLIARVRSRLSTSEIFFLSYCQANPMKYLENTNFLAHWGPHEDIRGFMHAEGLHLLAIGLVKEDASFLWHLLRRLDMDRGYIFEQALQKACQNPHVDYFSDRLEQCMKLLIQ